MHVFSSIIIDFVFVVQVFPVHCMRKFLTVKLTFVEFMIKRKANYFISIRYELNLFHFKVRVISSSSAELKSLSAKKQLISIHI